MDKITMNDINNILDLATSKVLNEELKDMKENKNKIEKFITGFKSDLAIDFLYKFYSLCVSNIPESVYNSHIYEPFNYPKRKLYKNTSYTCKYKTKTILGETKYNNDRSEIAINNKKINYKLLENNNMLGVFIYIYKNTKYFCDKSLYIDNSMVHKLYLRLNKLNSAKFEEKTILDPFCCFQIEELLQTAGLSLLYDNYPTNIYEKKLLCHKITIIRAMSEFYLPLTSCHIVNFLKNCSYSKSNMCFIVVSTILPKIYEEFKENLCSLSFEIKANEMSEIINVFLADFQKIFSKELITSKIKMLLTNNIKVLFADNANNHLIDEKSYISDIEKLLESEASKDDPHKSLNSTVKKLVDILKDLTEKPKDSPYYTSDEFIKIQEDIINELYSKADTIVHLIDSYIKPYISIDFTVNWKKEYKVLPEFQREIELVTNTGKRIIKTINTDEILSNNSHYFTYNDTYNELFSGIRKDLLSAFNHMEQRVELLDRLIREVRFNDIYRIIQIHKLVSDDNLSKKIYKKYKKIRRRFSKFTNKSNVQKLYKIYLPYLYFNESILLKDARHISLASYVEIYENKFKEKSETIFFNIKNPILLYDDLTSTYQPFNNIADIVYGYACVNKYKPPATKKIK